MTRSVPEIATALAHRLITVEGTSLSHAGAVQTVCEKLRNPLIRFAGVDGFASLQQRALALARVEVPALHAVKLSPDCVLDGLDLLPIDSTSGAPDAAVTIIAHLLGLLIEFIGEPLTLHIVGEAWPDEFNE